MSHLDILLPFSLPTTELSADLLRQCKAPAFALLLARAKASRSETIDAFSRSLPHEIWLSRQFHLENSDPEETSPALATVIMRHLGLTVPPGFWFIVQPVHFHVARDHLVLTDTRQLRMTEEESRELFAAALPAFEESGKKLLYGNQSIWFAQVDDWANLHTASPDAACGHNIDIWMPQGNHALAWRKLQNEVQMHWHFHSVNQKREAQGDKPINSIWLWGGAASAAKPASVPYTATFNLPGWMQGLAALDGKQQQSGRASDVIAATPKHGLLVLDHLLPPALAGDWGTWLEQMHKLEEEWFAPLLSALKSGALHELNLILSHNTRLTELAVTKTSLLKFWAKPTLARLAP